MLEVDRAHPFQRSSSDVVPNSPPPAPTQSVSLELGAFSDDDDDRQTREGTGGECRRPREIGIDCLFANSAGGVGEPCAVDSADDRWRIEQRRGESISRQSSHGAVADKRGPIFDAVRGPIRSDPVTSVDGQFRRQRTSAACMRPGPTLLGQMPRLLLGHRPWVLLGQCSEQRRRPRTGSLAEVAGVFKSDFHDRLLATDACSHQSTTNGR